MKLQTVCLALLCAATPPLLAPDTAFSGTLRTEYAVTVRGFPVGRAWMQAEFADGRYSIQFSGGIRGLARLFSDAETSAAAVGEVDADRLTPDKYKHLWREDNETETVDIRFAGRGLKSMVLDPPRRHPERYVPLSDENKADVLDPVSAFVWRVDGKLRPDTCNRTLPLIDGRRRFDIALAFSRVEDFSTSDRSYSNRAVVCGFSYRQVAGHKKGKKSGGSIVNGDGMEVWLAPVGDGLAVPARIQLSTRIGRVVLKATKLTTE